MMNVVNSGSRYQIYGEEVKTYNELPIGSYEVIFNKMMGFSLVSRPDLAAHEAKIYGDHERKVNKVLRSFGIADRNFGIILSGQKGIGKSLFARLLAQKSLDEGYPVILVSEAYPGLDSFLGSIEQEVVVIFDEFEKTFGGNDEYDPQEALLSMFDGIDGGKKLFVITCNEVKRLNSYLLNRPGRFHYHFQLTNPCAEEVREYLEDKLEPQYKDIIPRIIRFSQGTDVTYDYLRAIVFEVNQGYDLNEALSDLNISRALAYYDITVCLSDGTVFMNHDYRMDLFCTGRDDHRTANMRSQPVTPDGRYMDGSRYNEYGYLTFSPTDVEYKGENEMFIPVDKVEFSFDEDNYDGYEDDSEQLKAIKDRDAKRKVTSVTITKINTTSLNTYSGAF